MLFGVHKGTLELRFIADNYTLTGTEVVIDGKRRDRDTKKGFWTDNVKEVTDYLEARYVDDQYRLETALAKLHNDHEMRVNFLHAQLKDHNNAWLD
jgi:hypothetical protein